MPPVNYIAAKPTRYNGITYRSRLEAGWAVFWDRIGFHRPVAGTRSHLLRAYESFVGASVDGRAINHRTDDYCPDFTLVRTDAGTESKECLTFFQEIKPLFPNQEYVEKLIYHSGRIGYYGHSIFLTVGGFRDAEPPKVYPYPYQPYFGWTVAEWLYDVVDGDLDLVSEASEAAANFRWDLYRE